VHTGIDSELLEDVAKMSIYGMRGDEELVSDLPVGAPVPGGVRTALAGLLALKVRYPRGYLGGT
jgi:hypothetical protein